MQKLTIEHLAPYLPYGLNVRFNPILPPATLGVDNINIFLKNQSLCKPLLLPLSALTFEQLKEIIKHLFKDSQMIKPSYRDDENKIRCEKGFITFYDDSTMQRYTAVKPGGDYLPVLNMSNHFSDYEIFFKLHIDLFGLLEKGLALNKLDYPLTPNK